MTSPDIERMRSGSLRQDVDLGTRWVPNHGAAANGLCVVRSLDGHFPERWVRSVSGFEAVAELIR